MLGCKAAEGLTKLGYTDEAIAMLIEIEKNFRKAIRPKQLRALALARRSAKTGNEQDLAAAQDILAELYEVAETRSRDPRYFCENVDGSVRENKRYTLFAPIKKLLCECFCSCPR